MRLKLLPIVLLSFLFSCEPNEQCDNIDVSNSTLKVEFKHLTGNILNIENQKMTEKFMRKNPVVARSIFGKGSYPDSVFFKDMTNRFTHTEFKTLAANAFTYFSQDPHFEKDVTAAFQRVNVYFPDYELPEIITGVTGFADNTQLVDLDSLLFISLDFFLGDESPYQANTFEYMKPFYRKEMVPRSILFAKIGPDLLKTKQLENEEDIPLPVLNNNITLLDDMITFGRLLYFTKKTLSCPHDSIVTGFTTHELTVLRENKDMLWEHFIKNELLYSTDHMIKVRYMEPRPFTNEISQECPGRIGQWFGYQIVKQYMEKNPKVTIPELMAETDEQKIFTKSKFRP